MTHTSFNQRMIQIGDVRLHTESLGDCSKPACLFIAGAMAPGRFWTDTFCKIFINHGFFVIRFDHRDVGESSAVWKKYPYDLNDLANDSMAILDAYGIQKAHVIGHSMGGHVCQKIAVNQPGRIFSMTIISSGPIGATIETDRPLTADEQEILNTTWKVFGSRKEESTLESQIQEFLTVWRYLNGNIPLDDAMARAYTRDLLTRTSHEIRAGNPHELLMRNMQINQHRGHLQKIHVPTLVIHGSHDPLALPREGIATAHAIPHAKLSMIPGMGHMFFNRALETQIANLVITHLNSNITGK